MGERVYGRERVYGPWAQLLREVALGPASRFRPYIALLPPPPAPAGGPEGGGDPGGMGCEWGAGAGGDGGEGGGGGDGAGEGLPGWLWGEAEREVLLPGPLGRAARDMRESADRVRRPPPPQ